MTDTRQPPRRPRTRPRRAAPGPADTAELNSPQRNSPAVLLRLAQLRAFDEFHRHFAGLGVTPAGFSVFTLIAENPGVRPGMIGDELRIKPSNVAALVNALVAEGLVERVPDASELRANLLYPTKAGRQAYREMKRSGEETDARIVQNLAADERAQLVALLRKLLHR